MFYLYNNETNEYTHEAQGQPSPLEDGVFFQPPFSSVVEPPTITDGQKAVWAISLWNLVDDNRDKNYWYKSTKEKVVFALGDVIDDTMTNLEPAYNEVWESTAWAVPLLVAQEEKTIEIDAYAKTLVENAYANPTIEQVGIDPALHRNEMSLRRNNKADKLAGEKVLTQDEKDEAKIDQKLSEFEYKISQDRNKAVTNMLKLNTAAEVNDFDVSAENWNVWISPA